MVCCLAITFFVLLSLFVSLSEGAENPAQQQSPFFALCMDTHDEKKRSIEEQNEMLRGLGFDGVAHLWHRGKLKKEELLERAASAKRLGLKVSQVVVRIDLAAEQPFDASLFEALPSVNEQGTQLALLVYGGKPSDTSLDDKMVGIIQRILDVAEPLGIRVVLYPHENALCEKVSDALRIAERFSDKKVGVMFNLSHWAAIDKSENLESVLRLAMPYLASITINGSDTPEEIQAKTGNWIQPLDSGSFDLTKLFKILDDLGYHGPVGLQCYKLPGDARIHLERSMKKWKSLRSTSMNPMNKKTNYKIVDYTKIEGVVCPCGIARRGLYDVDEFPGTIHRTDIDRAALPHYHKKLTEVYYIVSCEPGAVMCLDGDRIELREEMALYIPPGTVHHLEGKAKVFIVVLPKFDPDDEFFPASE